MPSMANLDYRDYQQLTDDLANGPVHALAEPVPFLFRELFATNRARIIL